jgi:glutaminyl-peptide cyclotransferase
MTVRLIKKLVKKFISFGPRLPGTQGHKQTLDYMINYFKKRKWTNEIDTSHQKIPNGNIQEFNTLISTSNTDKSTKKIILCTHYDSKKIDGATNFIGATDALVPMALIMVLANFYTKMLKKNDASPVLQCIFFDGEESFDVWSSTDGIYGAKNLAQRWKNEGKLQDITLLINLDLLGAHKPKFQHFFHHESHDYYATLRQCERDLRNNGKIVTKHVYFSPDITEAKIEDDFLPFHENGVPVLHIIPRPFPDVWHTANDNYEALCWSTIRDLYLIFSSFIKRIL